MEFDATFWALIALLFFGGVALYLKAPAMVTKSLDERSNKIRSDLDEARRLREEAQELLAEYQRKRREAEKDAEQIISVAKREAEQMAKEAAAKSADFIARRTANAEIKIAQAESQAVADVRAAAVDIAIAAAENLIAARAPAVSAALFRDGVAQMKARLD